MPIVNIGYIYKVSITTHQYTWAHLWMSSICAHTLKAIGPLGNDILEIEVWVNL